MEKKCSQKCITNSVCRNSFKGISVKANDVQVILPPGAAVGAGAGGDGGCKESREWDEDLPGAGWEATETFAVSQDLH